jgi:hypothetical protein
MKGIFLLSKLKVMGMHGPFWKDWRNSRNKGERHHLKFEEKCINFNNIF